MQSQAVNVKHISHARVPSCEASTKTLLRRAVPESAVTMRAPAGWLAGEEAANGSAALLSLAEHSLLLRAHGAPPGGVGMALDAPGPGAGPPLASGLGGPLGAHAGGPWGVVAGASVTLCPAEPASCAAVSAPAPARAPARRRGSGGGRNAKASSSQYRCGARAGPAAGCTLLAG